MVKEKQKGDWAGLPHPDTHHSLPTGEAGCAPPIFLSMTLIWPQGQPGPCTLLTKSLGFKSSIYSCFCRMISFP